MSNALSTALFVLAGYVAGSMPFGYWLVRVFKGVDIRTVGSGNIGASNVWRTYGAEPRFDGDGAGRAEGLRSGLSGYEVRRRPGRRPGRRRGDGRPLAPAFLGFQKGGKMVATCGGALFGVAPVVGGICAVVWVAVFLAFRYASLASILTA